MEQARYSDEDLKFFENLIVDKLAEADKQLTLTKEFLNRSSENGTDDTSPTFKPSEAGEETLSRESANILLQKQEKFTQGLRNALVRIENKSYGVCRVSGTLIPRERLIAVPHATLTVAAKNEQYTASANNEDTKL